MRGKRTPPGGAVQVASLVDNLDERFRLVADAVPVPLWLTGPDRAAVWFNRAWLALVGSTLDEEIAAGWTAHVHPEDLPRVLAAYSSGFERRMPLEVEYRLRRHDGEFRTVVAAGVPVPASGPGPAGYVSVCRDITDDRLASADRAYLAAIVESSDDAILSKDLDGVIRSCNASAARMFGYAASELIGRSVRLLVPPDRQREEDEILARLRRGERIDHFETVRVRKDGRRLDVSLTISPVKGTAGEIVGVSSIARDITAQAHAAAELAAQQAWFQITLGSIGDAVIACDPAGRVTFMNSAAEQMTGWSQQNAAGRHLGNVFQVVGEETGEPLENPALGVMSRGQAARFANHTLLVARTGERRPIVGSAAPIRDAEQMLGAVLVFHDVTDERRRKEALAEQRDWFETTLGSIADAVIATDVQGGVTFMNAVAEHLTGWRADAARGRPCAEVFRVVDEQTRQSIEDPIGRALAAGVARSSGGQALLVAADGTQRPIDQSSAPIRSRDGRTSGVVLVFRDASEHRRAELERQSAAAERERLLESERAARADAERASRVKDEFLAMVSHELRTPLNAILGWTQLMRHGRQDPATLERGLDIISRNTRLQAQLISDLLDISRIVSGKLHLAIQSVDLRRLVGEAVDTVRPEAQSKGVAIRLQLDSGAGVIAGDPARLQQILWNLLSNAVKFTPSGGRIDVRLRSEHDHVQIVVADNGAGIRPEVIPHIFDRFHQADRSITRRFGGLGLGLSIVKHLVELHGGTVQASSSGEGMGATFMVSLPAGAGAVPGDQTRADARDDAGQRVWLEPMRILVVEDEPDTRAFLTRLLESHGATVDAAASAHEALQQFRSTPPDILISDIGLPGVDGYALMRGIRESDIPEGGTVPAIALTAFARPEDRTRALRAGYQAHITKPVEPGDLLATLASFAHLIEAHRRQA